MVVVAGYYFGGLAGGLGDGLGDGVGIVVL